MLSSQTYQKVENQFTTWLDEFMETEEAAKFSDFQQANIGKILNQLLVIGRTIERNPRTWTADNVLELVEGMCKTIPEEDEFFENLPLALAPFFKFAGEQKYVRHGQAIGAALLEAKDDIFQSAEVREELRYSLSLLQKAIDSGIDINNPRAVLEYMQKKEEEEQQLYRFFEQLEAKGIDLNGDLNPEEVMGVLQQEDFSIDLKEEQVARTVNFLRVKLLKDDNLDDALEGFPIELMPTLFGLMQSGRLEKELAKVGSIEQGTRYAGTTGKRRLKQKIGRNKPCPCGSRKKYKYCCGKRR